MEVEIPLLGKNDIDVRVQSTFKASNGKVYATLSLYKNARVDMRILDKVFGITGWQREHQTIDGKLYCTVSVWDEDKHQWIQKQDVGTENMQQAEKSEASDSFKRACFNVGIGRELYSAPNIFIRVVFPDPFGPIRPTILFGSTLKSTSLTAHNPPKLIEIFLVSNNAI